jgi:hypothetical protein
MPALGRKFGERIPVPGLKPADTAIAIDARIGSGLTTERVSMKRADSTVGNRDILLDDFAAELTAAAHSVALRRGVGGRWLDLELDLWRSQAETVQRRGREWPRASGPAASAAWWEGLVPELTAVAYHTTQRHGVRGSLREVTSALDQAFRSTIGTLATRRGHAPP